MDVRTQRKDGPTVAPGAACLEQIGRQLQRNHQAWLRELQEHPERLGTLEEQVHQRFQELADQLTASLLAQATATSPALAGAKKK